MTAIYLNESFHERYMPEPNSGCFLWLDSVKEWGHGQIRVEGKTLRAHRVAWELAYGKIPADVQVNHKCHTSCCVNPLHLYLGDQYQNMQDKKKAGRHHNTLKTHCIHGHEFTEENTYPQGKGRKHRGCRTCRTKYMKGYRKDEQ